MIQRLMRWFGYAPIPYGGPNVIVLTPDDVLVIKTPHHISDQTANALADKVGEKFPGRTVMVVSSGVELGVVRTVPAA